MPFPVQFVRTLRIGNILVGPTDRTLGLLTSMLYGTRKDISRVLNLQ